jgi:dienelactone hydrolase
MPDETDSRWKLRFAAPEVGLPRWAEATPERLAFVSTASGVRQVWSLDRVSGDRRQVSTDDVGVEHVLVAPDGRVVWWFDDVGDERGRWVAVSFDGGQPAPLVSGVPEGWSMGIAMVDETIAVGLSTDEDYRVYVAAGGAPARLVYRHEEPAGVGRSWPEGTGGLSSDGTLLCIRHAEHGDIIHPAMRVLDVATGETVADLEDPGRALDPIAWSPNGSRLLFTSELGPWERPAVWNPVARERRDLSVDVPGAVIPLAWYPDGVAVLARQEHDAIDRLLRVDVASGRATLVADPGGEIEDAAVRPDGEVWLTVSDTTHPLRPETASHDPVVETQEGSAPPGRSYRSHWFTNAGGDRIQAFLVTPDGTGPFPIVMHVHGGPEWHHRVRWEPEIQALADSGFAVALVNYRGSTGYGVPFRERLVGDPWFPESEDVVACLDALVADGVADGQRACLAGWSWGGCLACLNHGLHPDRWKAVFAGIPAGDFVAAHWASMPTIRAYDAALYGGDPTELPDLWRDRNPMTYADRGRAPLLVIAGENDPRCPPEGITPFTDALRARGIEVEVSMYPAGHHANATDERIRHVERILEFFLRHA